MLAENPRMLALAHKLGFVESRPGPASGTHAYGTHEIHLVLQPEGRRQHPPGQHPPEVSSTTSMALGQAVAVTPVNVPPATAPPVSRAARVARHR